MSNPVHIDKVLYTATASASNREGKVTSNDGNLDVQLSLPKSLGGPGGNGTNPEQLFAGGYAACFGSALAFVAKSKGIKTGPVTITAKVDIGAVGQGFGLAAELTAEIPELPRDQAQALLDAAHQVCPYSNATRGNIEVAIRLA
ncbi:Ohr family peroxiredoxin [Pendulispora rubella]|uniref:Ohr family peroxiredoxin n=1 Tax=Pendulispora rubella TaxID=2741070 RepID=A0ABZ2LMA7_9BACT